MNSILLLNDAELYTQLYTVHTWLKYWSSVKYDYKRNVDFIKFVLRLCNFLFASNEAVDD